MRFPLPTPTSRPQCRMEMATHFKNLLNGLERGHLLLWRVNKNLSYINRETYHLKADRKKLFPVSHFKFREIPVFMPKHVEQGRWRSYDLFYDQPRKRLCDKFCITVFLNDFLVRLHFSTNISFCNGLVDIIGCFKLICSEFTNFFCLNMS